MRDCWRNAIVELRSDDGGRTFRRVGLVAALPYRYAGEGAGRSGYFNPSNIIRRGDYLYAFVMAERTGAQRRGPCLLRRPVGGGPGDWRAWDGRGLHRPLRRPLPRGRGRSRRATSARRSRESAAPCRASSTRAGTYLAVTAATRARPDAAERSGIYWTISRDLVHWSPPALLWAAPLLWRRDCAAPAAYAYPALLDGDSASANFETVDDGFWLYLVEMRLGPGCSVGPRPRPDPAAGQLAFAIASAPATPPAPRGSPRLGTDVRPDVGLDRARRRPAPRSTSSAASIESIGASNRS